MARGKGFQGIVGRKVGTTWDTAVACGAGDGIEVLSIQADGNAAQIEDMQITGRITQREGNAGNRSAGCTLRTALRYEGNETDIALVMGTAGSPSTVETTGKKHTLKIADDMDGIMATVAFELVKDEVVVEIPSVKWNRLSLRGRQNERIELELQGIGQDWTTGSTTNDTTSIDTITLPANREYATLTQASLLMNTQAGATLASPTDVVYINGFEITLERAMEARYSTQFGNAPDEPIETGFMKVSGSFDFATVLTGSGGNTGFMQQQMDQTVMKAKLAISSATLAGSTSQVFEHVLWLPSIQFGPSKPGITGPEGLRWSQPFTCNHVVSAPNGFGTYLDALTWEIFSQKSSDPLA